MYIINFILNILIILGFFVVDGLTENFLGFFYIPLLLLFPKIRGILFNKSIDSNLAYEILELLLNLCLLVMISRSLFDNSLILGNYTYLPYTYMVTRLIYMNLILFLMNILLCRSKNKKYNIIISNLNFSYIILFVSIFSMYFTFIGDNNFIVAAILSFLSLYFSFKLIDENKHDQAGLFYAIAISIIGVVLSNEILIFAGIRVFALTYYRDRKIFYN